MTELAAPPAPTARWFQLPDHPEQDRLEDETWPFGPVRFALIAGGRRSYKSERAKRRIVREALCETRYHDAWYVFGGPTHNQTKNIAWDDLGRLIPKRYVRKVMTSELTYKLATGADITVAGLDKPSRIEGRPLDGIAVTEFANIKPSAWAEHIRPMLDNSDSTEEGRLGWAWLESVPEGRNHFYRLRNAWLERIAAGDTAYGVYSWKSADVLPAATIRAAMESLDERTFRQEYEGTFEDFGGRAYYAFSREVHAAEPLPYDPRAPLGLCFDFNRSPGVAVAAQEMTYKGSRENVKPTTLNAIGEVWIPRHSETPMVCERLADRWKDHRGEVVVYADATGGAGGSAKVKGSDLDLIMANNGALRRTFGDRLSIRVPRANPREKARVNAMNTLLLDATGMVGMMVDPGCTHLIEDLEGTVTLEGTDGQLDKKSDSMRTHMTDALGYMVAELHPVVGRGVEVYDEYEMAWLD